MRAIGRQLVCLVLAGHCAQAIAAEPLRKLTVDAGQSNAVIRSYQGVSGVPRGVVPGKVDFGSYPAEGPDLRQRWQAAHVDIVRSYIWHARLDTVDNPDSLFPKWDADPSKESSYNFALADEKVRDTRALGADIIFTIASSIPQNTKPPKDMAKWAEVVRHIALHYSKGWADGFTNAIRYWEIGDDPDVANLHFSGTPEQAYAMYEAASRAIKSVDATLRVGGPGLGFPLNDNAPYREGFLQAVKRRSLPLDFFSWQWYAERSEDPYDMVVVSRMMKQVLADNGFAGVPQLAPDWNIYANPSIVPDQLVKAVFQSATLTYLQESELARATLYRGDAAMGPKEKPDLELTTRMFYADGTPMKSGWAFTASGRMQDTPQRLPVTGSDDYGYAVIAGRNAKKDVVQVLITNYAIKPELLEPTTKTHLEYNIPIVDHPMLISIKQPPRRIHAVAKNNGGYDLQVNNLPWGKAPFTVERYRLDTTHDLALIDTTQGKGGAVHLSAELPPPSVELVVIRKLTK